MGMSNAWSWTIPVWERPSISQDVTFAGFSLPFIQFWQLGQFQRRQNATEKAIKHKAQLRWGGDISHFLFHFWSCPPPPEDSTSDFSARANVWKEAWSVSPGSDSRHGAGWQPAAHYSTTGTPTVKIGPICGEWTGAEFL